MQKNTENLSAPRLREKGSSSPETAASTGMNRDMNPTSIIQPTPDRAAVTRLKPGSKRATGAEEDIASGSAAAGGPLFQIVTGQDFSAATYLLEVRHPLLAPAARPSQFVIVQSHDRGERIPLTERVRNFSAVALGYTLENARRFNHPSPYLKGKVNTIR